MLILLALKLLIGSSPDPFDRIIVDSASVRVAYPAVLLQAGIAGKVHISGRSDTFGATDSARVVVTASQPAFAKSALAAVRELRFVDSATGRPRSGAWQLTLHFNPDVFGADYFLEDEPELVFGGRRFDEDGVEHITLGAVPRTPVPVGGRDAYLARLRVLGKLVGSDTGKTGELTTIICVGYDDADHLFAATEMAALSGIRRAIVSAPRCPPTHASMISYVDSLGRPLPRRELPGADPIRITIFEVSRLEPANVFAVRADVSQGTGTKHCQCRIRGERVTCHRTKFSVS